jgi:ribosome-interacting GTPase 1
MPTNLPPECQEIEREYRAATSVADKIALLEQLIGAIPKHKGTDKLRADYRRRLSKLRDAAAQARKSTGKRESPYSIDREGAGQAVIVGPTNVGKSALVAALTNASPEVSPAPFTTWQPTPGMMLTQNVQIQLIDTPPLDRDYVESEMLDLIRRADLILLVVDLQTDPMQQLADSVALLEEHRIVPDHLQHESVEQGPAKPQPYTGRRRPTSRPVLVLVNKYDDEEWAEVFDIFLELLEGDWPLIPVSAATGRNLEYLKQVVFERLEIIRVYSRAPGQEPDYSSPFTLKKGETVADFAGKLHQDFYENLKTARVWGTGVYDGQMVSRDHVLHDGDVVELRI